jgi:cysteinyl-tRNA synthetase
MYQAHYRSVLDLSNDALLASEKGLSKLMSGFQLIFELECNENESDFNVNKWVSNCFDKLNDDFNTPMLIAELFECVKFLNNVKIKSKNLNIGDRETIEKIFNSILFEILGFDLNNDEPNEKDSKTELIELLIKIRSQARENKNFKLSDEIRDELLSLGIKLNDNKNDSSFELI